MAAPARADAACAARVPISPDDHLAAIAAIESIGPDGGACSHMCASGVLNRVVATLVVAAHKHSSTARLARRIDSGASGQQHLVAQHLYRTPGLARRGAARIERARNMDHTIATATEHNQTVALGRRSSADHAGLVDDGSHGVTQSTCKHRHLTALSGDHAAVGRNGVDCSRVDRKTHQPCTRGVQAHARTRHQAGRAAIRRDGARVADTGRCEQHVATARSVDAAVIGDTAAAAGTAAEGVAAGNKVFVADGQTRCDETAHIDLRARCKHDARRIDQEHLAVGAE